MLHTPMPVFFNFIVFSFAASFLFHLSFSAVLAPVTLDRSFRFFTLSAHLQNSPQPTSLLLDISASLTWVANCSSTAYHSVPCDSNLCTALRYNVCSNCSLSSDHAACPTNSCVVFLGSRKRRVAMALADSFALPATDGRNPGRFTVIPEFVFSCSERSSSRRLGPKGTAALGRSNFSLAAQVSRMAPSSPHVFALCLSGSPSAPGVAFFGTPGPYYFLPQVDLSRFLVYTPLLSNPRRSTRRSAEYIIGLTDIRVGGKSIPLNQSLMNRKGLVGAKLSTLTPYTLLHSSIHKALVGTFINESAALNLTITEPVKPFDVCYEATDVTETNVGPQVPVVDFVMHGNDVRWSILGSNSMVRIFRGEVDVWCLGFVNGGEKLRPSIVVGGHQMVDNLLQFDLENNRLGFTSSVLVQNTMCANFNFTTNNTLGVNY